MTTEIAILNKAGLALAADSAMTLSIQGPEGQERKIYNTANKVFALSKHAPVAAMIYNNSRLMNIPWETIIKRYRSCLGKKRFSRLEDYCKDILRFLGKLPVSDDAKAQYVLQGAYAIFEGIKKDLAGFVEATIDEKEKTDETEVKSKLRELIAAESKNRAEYAKDAEFSEREKGRLRSKYRKPILDIAKQIFEDRPLTTQDRSRLTHIVVNAASKGPVRQSGLVVAGFGEDELYPSYFDYDISGVLLGKAVKRLQKSTAISDTNEAVISPFAQSDEVVTFMEGMGRDVNKFFDQTLSNMLKKYFPQKLVQAIREKVNVDDNAGCQMLQIASEMGKGAYDTIVADLRELKRRTYINPVIQATRFLQKDELATMAETLVNLVSFRKQVTLEAETVGGPIDVAVITKGDGLVWIKRKHYFQPELNHHFFRNYFDHGEDHDKQKNTQTPKKKNIPKRR